MRRNYDRWASETAMCMKKFGIWQQYSWRKYYQTVDRLSLGLISLGLQRGDVVCIIGDNEPEWFWSEFAVQAAGGIGTGIYVDSIPAEVKYIAGHSGAKFAIVNDQEQTDKFLEIKGELPALKKIIYWDPKGLKNYDDPMLISFNDVIKLGEEYEKANPKLFAQNIDRGSGDDIAFIYYTSGTTGLPKGARMSHRALISTAQGFIARYPIEGAICMMTQGSRAVGSDCRVAWSTFLPVDVFLASTMGLTATTVTCSSSTPCSIFTTTLVLLPTPTMTFSSVRVLKPESSALTL